MMEEVPIMPKMSGTQPKTMSKTKAAKEENCRHSMSKLKLDYRKIPERVLTYEGQTLNTLIIPIVSKSRGDTPWKIPEHVLTYE